MDHYKPPNMQWFGGATPLKKKLQGKLPRWKLLCFIFDDVSQKLWALYWNLLSFHLFLVVMYMEPFQNLIPHFPYVDNLINWNTNKLLFDVWLVGWCGARIIAYLLLCMACFEGLAFTFDGKNQGQWGASCNIGKPLLFVYMPIELGENIQIFTSCGRNKVIESLT